MNQPALQNTQTKIVSLIEKLGNDNEIFQNQKLDFMETNSNKLLANFKANLGDMEYEFKGMLESFKNGTFSPQEFEQLLDAEHKKGLFTLDLAEEMIKLLGVVFEGVRDIFTQATKGGPLNQSQVTSLVEVLDQSMESVIGISRMASSIPRNVLRNLNIVNIQKQDIRDQPEKGNFLQMMQEFQKGHLISNYKSKEISFEEAINAFSKPSANVEDTTNDSSSEPTTPTQDPLPETVKKSIRIHTFKVDSSYLTRPPVLSKSLTRMQENFNAHANNAVAGDGSTSLFPVPEATVESVDGSTQTDTVELQEVEPNVAFSFNYHPNGTATTTLTKRLA